MIPEHLWLLFLQDWELIFLSNPKAGLDRPKAFPLCFPQQLLALPDDASSRAVSLLPGLRWWWSPKREGAVASRHFPPLTWWKGGYNGFHLHSQGDKAEAPSPKEEHLSFSPPILRLARAPHLCNLHKPGWLERPLALIPTIQCALTF